MFHLFAQISTDSVYAANGGDNVSVLDLAMKGGLIMVPLLILSIIAVYIIVDRILVLKRAAVDPTQFMNQIKEKVLRGDVEGAKSLAQSKELPIYKMIFKGISKLGNPLKNIETSVENVGKLEIYRLEKNLSLLATIAGAAPMIGFLGTVGGMVQAFMEIAQQEGQISPQMLADGIYVAMITTIGGLIVGIVAYIGYNYITARLQSVIQSMEYSVIEFIELLQEPR